MEYIISPIWVFIELFSLFLFASAILQKKTSKTTVLVSFVVVWVINSLCAMFIYVPIIKNIITLTAIFSSIFICYKGSVLRKMLCCILALVFNGITDMLFAYSACAVMGIAYSELVLKKLLYVLVITVAKLIALFAAYLFHRFRKTKTQQPIYNRWLLLTILFPVLSIVMIFGLFAFFIGDEDISIAFFIFIAMITIANIATLYLIDIMEKRTKEEKELVLLNQQMRIQTNSIQSLERSYRTQREASHEFMRHLQTISDLLNSESVENARSYIRDLQGLQTTRIFAVNSHNAILDALFNQAYHLALDQSVDIAFQVNNLSSLPIKANALVVIFGNLLDNALEACQKVNAERKIICSAL